MKVVKLIWVLIIGYVVYSVASPKPPPPPPSAEQLLAQAKKEAEEAEAKSAVLKKCEAWKENLWPLALKSGLIAKEKGKEVQVTRAWYSLDADTKKLLVSNYNTCIRNSSGVDFVDVKSGKVVASKGIFSGVSLSE